VFSALFFSAVVFAGGVLVDEWEGDIYKYYAMFNFIKLVTI